MSPENARVFVVEDEKLWQKCLKRWLEKGGHQIVASATTLEQALEIAKRLKKMGVQVVTLDGNLRDKIRSGEDAQVVLREIRSHAPEVKVVGLSSDDIPGVDVDLGKENAFTSIDKVVKDL